MTNEQILVALDNNDPIFENLGLLQKYLEILVSGVARANKDKEIAWIKNLIDEVKSKLA